MSAYVPQIVNCNAHNRFVKIYNLLRISPVTDHQAGTSINVNVSTTVKVKLLKKEISIFFMFIVVNSLLQRFTPPENGLI